MDDWITEFRASGYHGCSRECGEKIIEENFKAEKCEKSYLGNGSYFYIDGISDPVEDARCWAKWKGAGSGFEDYSVLKVDINSERTFDLDNSEALQMLNHWRRSAHEKLEVQPQTKIDDGHLIDALARLFDLQATKRQLYAAASIISGKYNSLGRIPNTCVVCVHQPSSAIDLKSISIHETGKTSSPS